MSRIVKTTSRSAERLALEPARGGKLPPELAPRIASYMWMGGSGRTYTCRVHSLRGCPTSPRAIAILVRRDADDRRRIIAVLSCEHISSTLNRAEVRRLGARIGANEVHLIASRTTRAARTDICDDLSAIWDTAGHNSATRH